MAQISIRMDDNLKEQAEKLFEELGMNISTAFHVFVRQSLRDNGIPFTITADNDPFYSEANQRVLRESIRQAEEGKLTEHELIEV